MKATETIIMWSVWVICHFYPLEQTNTLFNIFLRYLLLYTCCFFFLKKAKKKGKIHHTTNSSCTVCAASSLFSSVFSKNLLKKTSEVKLSVQHKHPTHMWRCVIFYFVVKLKLSALCSCTESTVQQLFISCWPADSV